MHELVIVKYGPYKRKKDGRWIIILGGKTISYPKYLYEKHYNVEVVELMTVDHIDGNPNNNAITNLQLLTRVDNIKKSATGSTKVYLKCWACQKVFERLAAQARRTAGQRDFCSNSCKRNCQ